jgi:hypothetical protein
MRAYILRPLVAAHLVIAFVACGPSGAPSDPEPGALGASVPADSSVVLVDPSLAPAVAGEGGYLYQQRATADLDGDGAPETVVLTARVELIRGRPAWDDGQPWQLYVEEGDGTRTYLYARFVQLGAPTMRIALPGDRTQPTIIVLEHLPDSIAIFEAEYAAPGSVIIRQRFGRRLDPRGEVASPDLP